MVNMSGSCCGKPIAKIIKVGDSESGIVGLEEMFKNVYASGTMNEEEVKSKLLTLAKNYGNYITPSMEDAYENALLCEYKKFCEIMERVVKQESPKHR
jgi:hypothetical protein